MHDRHFRKRPASACGLLLALLLLAVPSLPAFAGAPVHHALEVTLTPHSGTLAVTDRITFPEVLESRLFDLHAGLAPRLLAPAGGRLEAVGTFDGPVPVRRYRLRLPKGADSATLTYSGTLSHALGERQEGFGRSRQQTPGYIGTDGVFLAASSHWYPQFSQSRRLTFTLSVDLPEGWSAVTQGTPGAEGEGTHWSEQQPQQALYLVAGPFHPYRRATAHGEAQVWLREADAPLAERYLEATERYLAFYSELIGPYPYGKFALVENFWETGYGMPSFTLLGPRVLRLPFIPYTSYPHEVLHSWWGNGVYADHAAGNWSEGLTTYLADHLMQEQRGRDLTYRRDALSRYGTHVGARAPFPLQAFTSRYDLASQAIGYGRGMMLFHMLRQQLGDDTFIAGLRHFYRTHRFRHATFADLQRSFEAVSGKALEHAFAPWLERTDAPELRLADVRVEVAEGAYHLHFVLHQTQSGAPYPLQVPVAVQGERATHWSHVALTQRRQPFTVAVPEPPWRIAVDPHFDLFRLLDPEALPPSLDRLFSAEQITLILPREAPPAQRDDYQALARLWTRGADANWVWDDRIDRLPERGAVWILGWENRYLPALERAATDLPVTLTPGAIRIAGDTVPPDSSIALAAGSPDRPLGFLTIGAADSPASLARRIPRYGSAGYLVFGDDGGAPGQGQWPLRDSPLEAVLVDGELPPLDLAPRPPLGAPAGDETHR